MALIYSEMENWSTYKIPLPPQICHSPTLVSRYNKNRQQLNNEEITAPTLKSDTKQFSLYMKILIQITKTPDNIRITLNKQEAPDTRNSI